MNQQSNLFTAVKQSVTPWQAASFYGLKPDKSGMCRCPFHNDHTPSLKLYADHFYCFGCGSSGDVIDLAGKLLSFSERDGRPVMPGFRDPSECRWMPSECYRRYHCGTCFDSHSIRQ